MNATKSASFITRDAIEPISVLGGGVQLARRKSLEWKHTWAIFTRILRRWSLVNSNSVSQNHIPFYCSPTGLSTVDELDLYKPFRWWRLWTPYRAAQPHPPPLRSPYIYHLNDGRRRSQSQSIEGCVLKRLDLQHSPAGTKHAANSSVVENRIPGFFIFKCWLPYKRPLASCSNIRLLSRYLSIGCLI